MKNRTLVVTAVIFIAVVVNYFFVLHHPPIRIVDFLFIFAMGMLGGLLLKQIVLLVRGK